jgi:hypothetical protein
MRCRPATVRTRNDRCNEPSALCATTSQRLDDGRAEKFTPESAAVKSPPPGALARRPDAARTSGPGLPFRHRPPGSVGCRRGAGTPRTGGRHPTAFGRPGRESCGFERIRTSSAWHLGCCSASRLRRAMPGGEGTPRASSERRRGASREGVQGFGAQGVACEDRPAPGPPRSRDGELPRRRPATVRGRAPRRPARARQGTLGGRSGTGPGGRQPRGSPARWPARGMGSAFARIVTGWVPCPEPRHVEEPCRGCSRARKSGRGSPPPA